MTDVERQMRERVSAFVAEQLSASALWDYLARIAWDIEENGDSDAEDFLHEAALLFSEHQRGHWSLVSLRERLGELVKLNSPPTASSFWKKSASSSQIASPVESEFATGLASHDLFVQKYQTNTVLFLSQECELV